MSDAERRRGAERVRDEVFVRETVVNRPVADLVHEPGRDRDAESQPSRLVRGRIQFLEDAGHELGHDVERDEMGGLVAAAGVRVPAEPSLVGEVELLAFAVEEGVVGGAGQDRRRGESRPRTCAPSSAARRELRLGPAAGSASRISARATFIRRRTSPPATACSPRARSKDSSKPVPDAAGAKASKASGLGGQDPGTRRKRHGERCRHQSPSDSQEVGPSFGGSGDSVASAGTPSATETPRWRPPARRSRGPAGAAPPGRPGTPSTSRSARTRRRRRRATRRRGGRNVPARPRSRRADRP